MGTGFVRFPPQFHKRGESVKKLEEEEEEEAEIEEGYEKYHILGGTS